MRALAVGLSVNTQKCEVNCHRSNACRCQWFCRLALWDVLNFASRARSFVMSSPESCRIKRFLKFISHFFSGRWDRASIRTRWSMFDLFITAKGGTLPSCYRSQGFRRCIAVVADLRISGQARKGLIGLSTFPKSQEQDGQFTAVATAERFLGLAGPSLARRSTFSRRCALGSEGPGIYCAAPTSSRRE